MMSWCSVVEEQTDCWLWKIVRQDTKVEIDNIPKTSRLANKGLLGHKKHLMLHLKLLLLTHPLILLLLLHESLLLPHILSLPRSVSFRRS